MVIIGFKMSGKVSYSGRSNHLGNNIFEAEKTALEKVIEEIVLDSKEDEELARIIDELQDYITNHPSRAIIGLESKLINAGRDAEYSDAVLLKNRFERRVAKGQLSITEQKVYVQVLSHILTAFRTQIRPLILEGNPKTIVDNAVFEKIIEPVHKAITSFDDMATTELILGMLYFLTGKCHVVWDKPC